MRVPTGRMISVRIVPRASRASGDLARKPSETDYRPGGHGCGTGSPIGRSLPRRPLLLCLSRRPGPFRLQRRNLMCRRAPLPTKHCSCKRCSRIRWRMRVQHQPQQRWTRTIRKSRSATRDTSPARGTGCWTRSNCAWPIPAGVVALVPPPLPCHCPLLLALIPLRLHTHLNNPECPGTDSNGHAAIRSDLNNALLLSAGMLGVRASETRRVPPARAYRDPMLLVKPEWQFAALCVPRLVGAWAARLAKMAHFAFPKKSSSQRLLLHSARA